MVVRQIKTREAEGVEYVAFIHSSFISNVLIVFGKSSCCKGPPGICTVLDAALTAGQSPKRAALRTSTVAALSSRRTFVYTRLSNKFIYLNNYNSFEGCSRSNACVGVCCACLKCDVEQIR